MRLSKLAKKKWELMAFVTIAIACCLMISCEKQAYAYVDPVWEEETTAVPEQAPEEFPPEETIQEETESEPGFSTLGNGDLKDEIKNSSGKDFYTIRTKNNNTFYLVIDHMNSSENVYMLSLIDENDLAEFMEQTEKETEAEVIPPVIIPTTPAATETPSEQPETEAPEPEKPQPFENSILWIIGGAALICGLLYYFIIYRPAHGEEESSEGMEMDDGLPTEQDD